MTSDGVAASAQRWISWLEESGMKVRSIALAAGLSPHTVQRWKVGSLAPSPAGVQALRLLVAVTKLYPTLGHGRVAMVTDDEFADEVDNLKLRALAPWEIDRTVKRG